MREKKCRSEFRCAVPIAATPTYSEKSAKTGAESGGKSGKKAVARIFTDVWPSAGCMA
jgi:hypothetical protein